MQKLVVACAALILLALCGAQAADIPLPNGSFELYSSVAGNPYYPSNWMVADTGATIQSIADSHAVNGSRVLKIDAPSYGYVWGDLGSSQVKANTTYTFAVYVAKQPSSTNAGGKIRLYVVPNKGVFDVGSTGTYVEFVVPTQTTDWQWTKYSVTFNSVNYPQMVGHYFIGFVYANSGYLNYDMATLVETSNVVPNPSARGKQWVRSHPFTVSAMVTAYGNMTYWNVGTYKACNFPTAHAWNFERTVEPKEAQFFHDLEANGLVWHNRLCEPSLPPSLPVDGMVNAISTPTQDNGWYIMDEPAHEYLPDLGTVADWLKQNRPNSLVYINVAQYLQDRTSTYYNDVMTIVRPDVLCYDEHPFYYSWYMTTYFPSYTYTQDYPYYFNVLMNIRNKAWQYQVPVFCWIQGFRAVETDPCRMASESEIRMHIFSQLAVGAKGITYQMYDRDIYTDSWFLGAIMDRGGIPSSLYYYVQDVNPEVSSLGRVLRYLENTDARFIPGRNAGSPNPTPSGLTNWSSGAGGDYNIVNPSVGASENGKVKDGLIGFFTDDTGQQYFMLANLYRGPSLSASAASLSFTITFNSTINGLWRLNRDTGVQEWVALSDHVLNTTLPGGTGDLYTYSANGFDLSAPQGSISINSGAVATNSTSVTLALLATDDRAVTRMRFSNDNLTWSDWESYSSNKQWSLTSGDGTKTVYVKYQDAVGTISPICSDTIILDTSPPGAPGTPTDAGAYTGSTSLVFTWGAATDTGGSGIGGYFCEVGSTPGLADVFSGDVGNSLSKTIQASYSNRYFCRVRAVDNAGNVGAWSQGSDGISVVQHAGLGIASAKALPTGQWVGLASKSVTAVYLDRFYIEELDRSAGILVRPIVDMPGGLAAGQLASVGGPIKRGSEGESWIEATF